MLLQPPNAWTPALPATAVQFQWQHPGASPASPVRFWFTLEQYHTAAQQWVLVLQTWSPTGTGLLVQGLAPGSYYRWQVAAFDGVLWSAPSAAAFFATRPP
jgi:hypothetical protein